MHSVTSNAVAEEVAKPKVKYIVISGTSDTSGNMRILDLPANTIPILFTSAPEGTDANYNVFYSAIVQAFFVHISNFGNGDGISNVPILGRVYYSEYSN